MTRRNLAFYLPDEGGNRLGGGSNEVRVYAGTSKASSTLATLYADDTTASTLTQPLHPNAGPQTNLSTSVVAGATSLSVDDSSGFQPGDEVPIRSGSTQEFKTILTAGSNVLTLSQGVINAWTAGALVGDYGMKGWVNAWLDDTQDYTMEITNVTTGRVGPRSALPLKLAPPSGTLVKLDEIIVGTTPGYANGVTTGILFPSPGTGSISQGYRNLILTYQARNNTATTGGDSMTMQLGTGGAAVDTGANYDYMDGYYHGPSSLSVTDAYAQTTMLVGISQGGAGLAGDAASGTIRFENYAGTSFQKMVRGDTTQLDSAAAGGIYRRTFSGRWRNTGGITSIKLVSSGGFVTGSTFALYAEP